jgi:rod shape-determining protein MreD
MSQMALYQGNQTAVADKARGISAVHLLPVATMALATLLPLEPINLTGYFIFTPALGLLVVYHWTIYRPDLLPPLALFAVGLFYDLLSGGPPGVTPLLFLVSRAAVLQCRRWFINRPFSFLWAGFILLTSSAMGAFWVLQSAFSLQFAGIVGSVFCAAIVISLFPILSYLLSRIQFGLIGAD